MLVAYLWFLSFQSRCDHSLPLLFFEYWRVFQVRLPVGPDASSRLRTASVRLRRVLGMRGASPDRRGEPPGRLVQDGPPGRPGRGRGQRAPGARHRPAARRRRLHHARGHFR